MDEPLDNNGSSGRPRPSGTKMTKDKIDLVELITMKKWQSAKTFIESNKDTVYERYGTTRRLAIHEVCKIVRSPEVPATSGEVSDDEEETDGVSGAEGGGGGVDAALCLECVIEDNRQLCELAKLMIDIGSSLGPYKLQVPLNDADNNNEREEDGNRQQVVDQVEEENRFEVFSSILTVTDSMGKTPLHILCEQSADSNMMKAILETTTKEHCTPTATCLLSAKDSRGSTPLHYLAYSRHCPFSSLEIMMDYAKPTPGEDGGGNVSDATLCTDEDGDTPLHWALDGYISARRVKQLIRYSKDALSIRNAAGKSPFDLFAGNFVDNDWAQHELCGREVWDNIQGYLKVVVDQEHCKPEEWFPVHVLAASTFPFPSVFMDIALQFNKEDLSKPNLTGHLPLHLACARISSTEENAGDEPSVATKILLGNPQAAYKPVVGTKRLALHIAIETHKPLPLIAALLKIYPSSLNATDPNSGLWPFLLAGSCDGDKVDISYCLLRADPSIIQVAIRASISKRGQRAAQARRDMEKEYANDHFSRRTRRFRGHDG